MISINLDEIVDIDLLGELLRHLFFEEYDEMDVGCYSTFEVRENVVYIGHEPVGGEDLELYWDVYEDHRGIRMRYFWDGDGLLEFQLPDGTIIYNHDCKKDHGWEISEPV